jgi:multidrug efflux pump subunit AcrB
MNPIDFALRRPWTVLVAVTALALLAGVAVRRMKIDVFPSLNSPMVYVCQPYGGMDPAQMEGLLTNYYESLLSGYKSNNFNWLRSVSCSDASISA